MARTRVSITVNHDLLAEARRVSGAGSDETLFDQALSALLAQRRPADVDHSYAAYEQQPISEPDEWGDLASFREAAASS